MSLYTKPIVVAAFCAAFFCQDLQAQDPRFSQYYNSPWTLNPAMTGLFNGRYRVVANYRDQWNSFLSPNPFRTFSAAVDVRYAVANDDYVAFGFGAMHDEAGNSNFQQNKANAGLSFLKQLTGGRNEAHHYLSAGAQVGFGQNSLNWSKMWFSRQFNTSTELPDQTLGNGENTTNSSTNLYLDFNAGLLWYAIFGEGGFVYGGAAMQHINQPGISFLDDNKEKLYARWMAHTGAQLPMSDNLAVLPSLQVMRQGPAFECDFGANIRYSNNDRNELALRAGMGARLGNKLDKGIGMDALVFSAMLELSRWSLGLSYDVTTSSLTAANNSRGAFELALIYYHPEYRRTRVKCPKM